MKKEKKDKTLIYSESTVSKNASHTPRTLLRLSNLVHFEWRLTVPRTIDETTIEDAYAFVALNYNGMHFYLFHACLFLFCLHIAHVRKTANPVSLLIFTYGGSTLAAAILGVKPFILSNHFAIPTFLIAKGAVTLLPEKYFSSTFAQWTLRVGTELCRSAIATTWFGHAQRVRGDLLQSVLIGTIAGTFGAVLGLRTFQPIISSPTIASLFTVMYVYAFMLEHHPPQVENRSRTLIVLWMLAGQYVMPQVYKRLFSPVLGRARRVKQD